MIRRRRLVARDIFERERELSSALARGRHELRMEEAREISNVGENGKKRANGEKHESRRECDRLCSTWDDTCCWVVSWQKKKKRRKVMWGGVDESLARFVEDERDDEECRWSVLRGKRREKTVL